LPDPLRLPEYVMCNSYRVTPRRGADGGIRDKVSVAAGKLASSSSLVRKSDPGIVVCSLSGWR
jgi:hypothetical protein